MEKARGKLDSLGGAYTASSTGSINGERPTMIWDGECAFCAQWISRWRKITGDAVNYAPYQFFDTDSNGKLKRFPVLSVHDCKRAVCLMMPTGTAYHGAEAVFRAFEVAGKKKLLLWFYRHLPGFSVCAEVVYKVIASHRSLFSKIFRQNV